VDVLDGRLGRRAETDTGAARLERLERLTSIRRLLLTMIRTARESTARDRANFQR